MNQINPNSASSVAVENHRPSNDDTRQESAEESWAKFIASNESIVVQSFYGQLMSTLQCRACGRKTTTYQPICSLSLPIPNREQAAVPDTDDDTSAEQDTNVCESAIRVLPSVDIPASPPTMRPLTLGDCLDLFLSSEALDSDGVCSGCGVKDQVIKLDITRLPPILVVQLKRFAFECGIAKKIADLVEFPVSVPFDMSPWIQGVASLYDLQGVVNHHGSEPTSGHCTAFGKNLNGKWYRFDDKLAYEVNNCQVMTDDAYVLLFQLRNISTGSLTVEPEDKMETGESSDSSVERRSNGL